MALSDHEQKLLSQLEQQLVSEDPKFASTMRGASIGLRSGKRLVIGVLGLLVGLAVLVGAVALRQPLLAVVGGPLMVAGVSYALSRQKSPEAASASHRPGTQPGSDGLFNRLEERWERRREQDSNGNT